jgi:hypothetical protein
MAKVVHITGVNEVIKNLRRAGVRSGKKVEIGLKRGGLLLQRLSEEVVPVDTSNLKGSSFTRSKGRGFSTDVVVGYTAEYAVYVHERTELRHAPGKQAKFLEGPGREHRKDILESIAGRPTEF